MSLIVQKFGGSSVANAERVFNVAKIVTDTYKKGNKVVVVVSAQGDTTDDLIDKANEINPDASKREKDMLLAAGEQISIALLAMAIEKLGYPVVSLLGWQAGFETTSAYTSARIKRVRTDRIEKELDKKNIVIVAGFQGLNRYEDVTTLGRGGSDTSAVAIAAAMHADLCQIFTDVEGVYTADPRKVANAKKLQTISYDEMLELATLGAQVLNNRSVEMAKKYNIELEVLSSLTNAPGTIVKEAAKLSKRNINVDIILQSIGRDGTKDISFTVAKDNAKEAAEAMEDYVANVGGKSVLVDEKVAKISIVGAGMESHAGVATKMFEALYDAQINIRMISTSEIKVSVLIDEKDADAAVNAIHSKFFD